MVQDANRGQQDESKQELSGQQDIGIKGSPNIYAQQPNMYPQPYYQTGRPPGFPLIPVTPYSKGLALSVIVMAIGAVLEKIFQNDYYRYNDNPLYYVGMVLFYLGAISAFLNGLGLFLLPPRQDPSTGGPSSAHFGIAFVMAAVILGIALH